MATRLKKSASHPQSNISNIADKKFAILVAEWNAEITEALYQGAYDALLKSGASKENLVRRTVPGSFELSLAAQWTAQKPEIDAVICLGCVIQGDTKHFDFICQAVAMGLVEVSLKYNKPIIFGVLTPNTYQQALDRAGGKFGNKGEEAAMVAVSMLGFNEQKN